MNRLYGVLSIVQGIHVQDILDMAIIATLIFALLVWFKKRASRYVLVGIFFLGIIYMAARFFELKLTVVVLQGFFAILLFVLVVIFQEDLRAFFERLAMLGKLRKRPRPLSGLEKTASVISEAAASLAKKRVGALMVLQGDDPLVRHLTGGVELGGRISTELVESLFDSHSPGHDGAVVIGGDRVLRFGCHLPLSVNISRYANIGLRHTAALGLTERSDALCIVVSEERGTISVARGESLTLVSNPSVLQDKLEAFYLSFASVPKTRPLISWLMENTREKIIAVILAFVLWVAFSHPVDPADSAVAHAAYVLKTVDVQVATLNALPDHLVIKSLTVEPAFVTVRVDARLKSEPITLLTEPVDLQKVRGFVSRQVRIMPKAGVVFPEDHPATARVVMDVEAKTNDTENSTQP